MKELIGSYLKDHETAWAPTTLRSETSRLRSVAVYLDLGPGKLYDRVKGSMKPYAVKTLFIRICALERWAKLEPLYQDWFYRHRFKFKYAYKKVEVNANFEDVSRSLRTLAGTHPAGVHALGLLASGLRMSESYNLAGNEVTGKGSKTRKVYGKIDLTVPKTTLRRKLKALGLKPHDLRKLCATRLAEKGATAADLCKVFGWSNIRTAFQYLEAKDDERLEALMEESQKEG
jgi:integrase